MLAKRGSGYSFLLALWAHYLLSVCFLSGPLRFATENKQANSGPKGLEERNTDETRKKGEKKKAGESFVPFIFLFISPFSASRLIILIFPAH